MYGQALIAGYYLDYETVYEIGKFAILWNDFENSYFNNGCSPTAIKRTISRLLINQDAQKHLADILNKRRNTFGQSVENYVDISLHPRNARHGQSEDSLFMEEFLKQNGNNIDCGCLLTIARIRNNMMHGLKCVGDLNDQIELFRAVNQVLESITRKQI